MPRSPHCRKAASAKLCRPQQHPLEVLQEEVVDSQGQAEQEGGSSLLARSFFSHKRVWLTFTQVDQNIDFRYLLAPRTDPRALLQATPGLVSPPPPGLLPPGLVSASSDEEGGYDLTSEVFLENVDDEFMPNFPQPDAAVRSGAGSGSTRWAIFKFISVLCVARDTLLMLRPFLTLISQVLILTCYASFNKYACMPN